MAEVYINYKFVGTVEDPATFISAFKDERRKGSISSNVNIFFKEECNEIHIEASKGRARRPFVNLLSSRLLLNLAMMMASVKPVTS